VHERETFITKVGCVGPERERERRLLETSLWARHLSGRERCSLPEFRRERCLLLVRWIY
jgi:hypothetical protein